MLSSSDITDWFQTVGLKMPPNIIRYPELHESDVNIADIEIGECNFLLYEAQPRIGHWTILFYNGIDDMVEFFDPMGFNVDDELKFSYHKEPTLLSMMSKSKEPFFEVNRVKYQQPGTETCGVWCCLRYLFSYLGYSVKDFENTFYKNVDKSSRDEIARLLFDIFGDDKLGQQDEYDSSEEDTQYNDEVEYI